MDNFIKGALLLILFGTIAIAYESWALGFFALLLFFGFCTLGKEDDTP